MKTAVTYLRMSSEMQDMSIEQQRRELLLWAEKHGYTILREYVDAGLSGVRNQEKRLGFQKMLLDSNDGEFTHVLCWNMARFGRQDVIDGAFAKQILRNNGVVLVTISEGEIDWNTQEGRFKDLFLSEQAHSYSRTLGKDSVRGRAARFREGYWGVGAVPFGYDRLYSFGTETKFVPRETPWQKGRQWRLKLVINDVEADIIREIFKLYIEKNYSDYAIARQLNERGIPAPKPLTGRPTQGWTNAAVKGVLIKKAYTGTAQLGYARQTCKTAMNRVEKSEHANACPPIVTAAIYAEAAKIRAKKRGERRKTKSDQAGAFSGHVICGHCGYRLEKRSRPGQDPYYVCASGLHRQGPKSCKQWSVKEGDLLLLVGGEIMDRVDFEILKLLESKPKKSTLTDSEVLAAHVASLEKQLDTAMSRWLTCPSHLEAAARKGTEEVKSRLDEARQKLNLITAASEKGSVQHLAEWWAKMKSAVITLNRGDEAEAGEQPITYDRHQFRALLERLGVVVTLYWIPRGKTRYYQLDKGKISVEFTWQDVSADSITRKDNLLISFAFNLNKIPVPARH